LTNRLAAIELGEAFADRLLLVGTGCVDASAARLDVASELDKLLLVLFGPGLHSLKQLFGRWAHMTNIAYSPVPCHALPESSLDDCMRAAEIAPALPANER